MKIYLDNMATVPLDREVFNEMESYFFETFANYSLMEMALFSASWQFSLPFNICSSAPAPVSCCCRMCCA